MNDWKVTSSCAVLAVLCAGCVTTPDYSAYAVVDDTSFQDGFRIVAVDGNPVKRAEDRIATVVPVALLEPGERILEIQKDLDGKFELIAFVESGRRYQIISRDGLPSLQESETNGSTAEQGTGGNAF